MFSLKSAFLFLLLSTVASRVKGSSTTVTLFDAQPLQATQGGEIVTNISAIGLGPNGGTAYVEEIQITSLVLVIASNSDMPERTTTETGTTFVAPVTATFVEAASWLYMSSPDKSNKFNNDELNCTLGTNDTTSECVDILRILDNGTTSALTTTFPATVVPLYTLTVTGPIPTQTTTNAATNIGNPMLSSVFLGTSFFVMMSIYS